MADPAVEAARRQMTAVGDPSCAIAGAMDAHWLKMPYPYRCGGCDWAGTKLDDHRDHVAEMAVLALRSSGFSIIPAS
ncbi:MAG: hypothetical protein WAV90_13830 [Gordonia amarae]